MKISRFILFLVFVMGNMSFSQEEYYEPEVDSDWIASQNEGESIVEENTTESNPDCIGDGCDLKEITNQKDENSVAEEDSVEKKTELDNGSQDSIAKDTIKPAQNGIEEYEDCTEADSSNTECIEVEETNTFDRYQEENAEMYKARKEGFSRSVQIGFRALGGINTLFGKKSDGFGLGFQGGAGVLVKMPIGIRYLSLVPELDFVYRKYNYEKKNDYSKNEASINYTLFEIPIILRYTFDEDNFFVGLGLNVDLKLTGSSEWNQKNIETYEKDKRNNSLPTSGVELGGVFNIGYSISRNFVLDLRIVQCFTNLLNEDSIAESSLIGADIFTFYTVIGFTFVF